MIDTTPHTDDTLEMKELEHDCTGRLFAYASMFRGDIKTQDVADALTFISGENKNNTVISNLHTRKA